MLKTKLNTVSTRRHAVLFTKVLSNAREIIVNLGRTEPDAVQGACSDGYGSQKTR